MGGLIGVIICVLAAMAFYGTEHSGLFWFSVATGVVAFWSWGIMHNHATMAAKRRHDLILANMRAEGRPDDEIAFFDSRVIRAGSANLDAVPNWLAVLNLLATLAGLVLLIWGAIVRLV